MSHFRYLIMIFSLCFVTKNSVASDIDCNLGGAQISVGGTFSIPNIDITMPRDSSVSGYTKIFDTDGAIIGGAQSTRVGCTGITQLHYSLVDAGTPLVSNYSIGGKVENIYPTTSNSLGLSFSEGVSGASGQRISAWPNSVYLQPLAVASSGSPVKTDVRVNMRLWSTPNVISPGSYSFTGPTFVAFITPSNSNDTIATCPAGSERMPGDTNKTCILLKRQVVVSAKLTIGTCDLVSGPKTVYMGSHDGASGQNSDWKESNFQLNCPLAYGYGTMYSGSTGANELSGGYVSYGGLKNKPVTIQIKPYTSAVSTIPGTFELDPGGATGYGIQLAWGAKDSPGSPVDFNARIKANALNNNFYDADWTGRLPGNRALPNGADSTIAMSARYIRIPGRTISPGPANGKVEVLASYE